MQLRQHHVRHDTEDLCTCSTEEMETDCFAGGGGAGYGFMLALGRSPKAAVNHDEEALAMYEANHPEAEIHHEDIRDVDPRTVARCPTCGGMRIIGAAWFSPDCKEHSKAKNGSLVRSKEIRCLPWQIVTWARTVRPRVIFVENVEEMLKWGPLNKLGRIIKRKQGQEFAAWIETMRHLGYRAEFRILRACDYGAPTSRKRLYVIFRCDGESIVWPEPTHGPGRAHPYRTAASCINFTLDCPSIFLTKAEAKQWQIDHNLDAPPKRPLVDKTMKRIARGLRKYVLEAKRPFIVPVSHGEKRPNEQPRVHDVLDPLRTVTCAHRGELAVVQPYLAGVGGRMGCSVERPVDKPYHTNTTKADTVLVAPTLIQTGYGEREGQAPRCLDLHKSLGTVVSCAQRHALVTAFLAKHFGDRPTGGWAGGADLAKGFGAVTCRDHHSLVTTNLVKMRGTSDAHMDASSMSVEDQVPTVSAGGNHIGEVRAFLTRYNGNGDDGRAQSPDEPMTTVDTSNRLGIVMVDGTEYQIVDIGMRMLTPRELARAQGLPDSWILDPEVVKVVQRGRKHKKLVTIRYRLSTKAQVRMIGNSVCADVGAALIRANYTPATYEVRTLAAA